MVREEGREEHVFFFVAKLGWTTVDNQSTFPIRTSEFVITNRLVLSLRDTSWWPLHPVPIVCCIFAEKRLFDSLQPILSDLFGTYYILVTLCSDRKELKMTQKQDMDYRHGKATLVEAIIYVHANLHMMSSFVSSTRAGEQARVKLEAHSIATQV